MAKLEIPKWKNEKEAAPIGRPRFCWEHPGNNNLARLPRSLPVLKRIIDQTFSSSTYIEIHARAIGLKVDDPNRQVDRVDADWDARQDHEYARQEKDEDEKDWVPLHRDPVLDEKGEDVGEFWNCAGPVWNLLVIFIPGWKSCLWLELHCWIYWLLCTFTFNAKLLKIC